MLLHYRKINSHYNCMKTMGRAKRMHKPELKYAGPFGILVSPLVTLIVIKFCLLHSSFVFTPAEIFWFLFNFIYCSYHYSRSCFPFIPMTQDVQLVVSNKTPFTNLKTSSQCKSISFLTSFKTETI